MIKHIITGGFGLRVVKTVSCCFLLMLLSLPPANSLAAENKTSSIKTDPMIKIISLPIKQNPAEVMAKVSEDVARDTGIDRNMVTYYWQTFDEIYCPGCESAKIKKPMFVELFVPGFMTTDEIQKTMISLASALERYTDYTRKDLFMHTHIASKEQLFILGDVVKNWSQVGGPDDADDQDQVRGEPVEPTQGTPLSQFLFKDPAFVFQSLWRFGLIATGGAELGEALTAVSRIRDGNHDDWYESWSSMAEHVQGQAWDFERKGHPTSAQEAFFRATTYYRTAEIYLDPSDPRVANTWLKGRKTFLEAAKLSDGRLRFVEIPYENTTLPGYWCRVDDSDKKRPLLIIQTGLDGTAEDLYFIMAVNALKRGYNCLIFEGPGQGEMIRIKNLPFRHDWEKVVTPVVDFALTLPEVDPSNIALLGYSMGGYLVPRALAYEHRVKYGIADGGVFSVFDGTITKFPAEVRDMLNDDKAEDEINQIAAARMREESDLDKFIVQMLWTFQADSPFHLLRKLQDYNQAASIDKISCEMLVLNSIDDQVAGSYEQSKIFYNALKAPKSYVEFTTAEGGQFHCQLGAPMFSGEQILNWLDERMMP